MGEYERGEGKSGNEWKKSGRSARIYRLPTSIFSTIKGGASSRAVNDERIYGSVMAVAPVEGTHRNALVRRHTHPHPPAPLAL